MDLCFWSKPLDADGSLSGIDPSHVSFFRSLFAILFTSNNVMGTSRTLQHKYALTARNKNEYWEQAVGGNETLRDSGFRTLTRLKTEI